MIQNVVVGQTQNVDAGLFDPIDARARFTKHWPRLQNRRRSFDQRTFQIRHHQAGFFKFGKQIIEQAPSVAIYEVWPITLNGTDIRTQDYGRHLLALALDRSQRHAIPAQRTLPIIDR
jgi:hypothetical protein